MPYLSDKQRAWAHTETGTKALGGKSHVKEWDKSSKGLDLPEYVKVQHKAHGGSVDSCDKCSMLIESMQNPKLLAVLKLAYGGPVFDVNTAAPILKENYSDHLKSALRNRRK